MTGFKLRISGEGSNRSTNCATTTARNKMLMTRLKRTKWCPELSRLKRAQG